MATATLEMLCMALMLRRQTRYYQGKLDLSHYLHQKLAMSPLLRHLCHCTIAIEWGGLINQYCYKSHKIIESEFRK